MLPGKKHPPAVLGGYLYGLAGVLLLVLLGGGQHVYALAGSLLLPGLALLRHPPQRSPGLWVDRFALLLLAVLLLGFLPLFYWPLPAWRVAASEQFGIQLPASLSVQPLISLEAWLAVLAGLGWFYAAASWQINYNGRKYFYLIFSCLAAVLALVIFWGNHQELRYPGAAAAGFFSFFPDARQSAVFLAVAGVVAWGYAMTVFGSRQVVPVFGFVAFGLCCVALAGGLASYGVGVLLLGLLLYYLLQWKLISMPKSVKWGVPLFLLLLSFLMLDIPTLPARGADAAAAVATGTVTNFLRMEGIVSMLQAAPLSGHGLGNFSAVFPQFQSVGAGAASGEVAVSDVLWLTAEAGLLGMLALIGLLLAYFRQCGSCHRGPSGSYRLVALAAWFVFILHGLTGASWHQPGTVYLALLLAALALPPSQQERPSLPRGLWMLVGGVLVSAGLLWGLAGVSGLPLHSKLVQEKYAAAAEAAASMDGGTEAVDAWIDRQPLNWRAYHLRAVTILTDTADVAAAAADFERARFVEPTRGLVPLEEGLAWIPYDRNRTLTAWREVFKRGVAKKEEAYQRMLAAAAEDGELLTNLAEISHLDRAFRFEYLRTLSGDDLMRELERERANDPGLIAYSSSQRSALVDWWIHAGDKVAAEQFLEAHASGLERPWWLWALLHKERAKFEAAVDAIRAAITPPELPVAVFKGLPLERLQAEFAVSPEDIARGSDLLQRYIAQTDYQAIRDLAETLLAARGELPGYMIYWEAESYYHLQDYIESWFLFERYLQQLWAQ